MNLGEGTPRQFQKGLLQRVSNLLFRIILYIFVFMKQGIHSIIYYADFVVIEIVIFCKSKVLFANKKLM
jgi:hypothetical protein